MGQLRDLWNVVLKEAGFPEVASSMEVTSSLFPLEQWNLEVGRVVRAHLRTCTFSLDTFTGLQFEKVIFLSQKKACLNY